MTHTFHTRRTSDRGANGNNHGGNERRKWVNNLGGYLVAPLITVPFSTHTVEHFTHHRYTNQPDKDPDYVVSNMRHGLLSFIASGFRFLWIQNTFLFRNYWATAARRPKMKLFDQVTLAIGWRVAFILFVSVCCGFAFMVVG